jgi:hypothetical protein
MSGAETAMSVVSGCLMFDTNTVPPIGGISKGVFDGESRKKYEPSKEKGCDEREANVCSVRRFASGAPGRAPDANTAHEPTARNAAPHCRPPGRKAKDMNVKLDSATTIGATRTVTIDRPRQAPLRITKRGRAVVTGLAAIPLVVGALVFAVNGGMATATQADNSATSQAATFKAATFKAATFKYVTVSSGQSLWQLAAAVAPSADPRDVVSDIVHLNQLDGADVQPGQRLAIPAQYTH